jgi:hypothetical protein
MYEHLYKNHNARNSRLGLEKCEEGRKKVYNFSKGHLIDGKNKRLVRKLI